jgi:phenylalanyl-tRNA synthetase alpha chain
MLDTMLGRLSDLRRRALDDLAACDSSAELNAWHSQYLGRQDGEVTAILRGLRDVAPEERKAIGQAANDLKVQLEEALAERRSEIASRELTASLASERIDVTLPARELPHGGLHPLTRTIRDVCAIFREMGFHIVEGPEVETDYYNFQALNIPPDHPARDMQDTFWVVPGEILLRTQTSPNQIRIMEQTRPPVRAVVPGKVYRNEATDATHEAMFHQIEGLMIDRTTTMRDLRGCFERFAKVLFGPRTAVRFRPSYFPFTEPSAEVDISCTICGGVGCRVCKYSGWVEIAGSGMVHPQVLRTVHYDPKVYRGFAFGMGVERIAMIRYGINEIRLFSQNDLRFLNQF